MTEISELRKEVENFLMQEGYELWDVEVSGVHSPNPVLRIYIEKPGGVGIEDCAYINRKIRLQGLFESHMGGDFYLEVSSPGVERKLFLPSHFARYIGRPVRVQMKNGRIYRGFVQSYEDGICILRVPQGTIYIPEEGRVNVRVEFTSPLEEKRKWK